MSLNPTHGHRLYALAETNTGATSAPIMYVNFLYNNEYKVLIYCQGPWLQLPLELLESLLVLNMDPATFAVPETRLSPLPPPPPSLHRLRDFGFHSLGDHSHPDSPRTMYSTLPL